ncbi:hypothetical protein [Confluentibacter citreus]|uniref:hypothetical protein n=1 Tax=Confluentibacter citreus TaxID=2007307 RepID=UPI0012FDE9CF|nr:hypothetical protein [Confluentibacter citreus]
MKYVIIASIITAVLAITAYILDFANNKTDKVFLIIVGSLLILSGLFFSIRGEVVKDKDSKEQAESLSKTKENTELIIQNINGNLERLSVINDSVTKLSTALSGVENDLTEQLKIFKKTLKQTEIFEQKVSEQLKLEKQRFELEKPEVEVVATLEKKPSLPGNQYGILFGYRNLGKRTAKDFNANAVIGISKDKKNITEHIKMESSLENFDITPAISGGVEIKLRSGNSIDLNGIEDDLRLIVLLKYTYRDEFLNKSFEKENYFFWYGFDKTGLVLVSANNDDFTKRLDKYIADNNLEL